MNSLIVSVFVPIDVGGGNHSGEGTGGTVRE